MKARKEKERDGKRVEHKVWSMDCVRVVINPQASKRVEGRSATATRTAAGPHGIVDVQLPPLHDHYAGLTSAVCATMSAWSGHSTKKQKKICGKLVFE